MEVAQGVFEHSFPSSDLKGRLKLKQMLSSLLESGTMSMSDADSVLYEEEAQKYMDVVEIPKIGYSIHRQVHHITVPRRFSRTGGRHPVYGKM